MGNSQGNLTTAESNQLLAATEFDRTELRRVFEQFSNKYSTGFMTRDEFIRENMALQGGTTALWEEVFDAFNSDGDDRINFKEYVLGISMVTGGASEDKLKWAFQLYDKDGNGVLDRNETVDMMATLLSARAVLQGEEENRGAVEASADDLFRQLDSNGDGQISWEEFKAGCEGCLGASACAAFAKSLLGAIEVVSKQENMETFDNQVAGHKGKDSMLKEAANILKPLATAEFEFYEQVRKLPDDVQKFFPSYFGRRSMADPSGKGANHYIVLEDLTKPLEAACICDLKIGKRGHDEQASTKKVLQQKALCAVTTSSSLGFRMCGMRYWRKDGTSPVVRDKPWGAKLRDSTMRAALVEFIDNGEEIRFDVIDSWLPKLRTILSWFESQTSFHFYSSSVLLIYDAKGTGVDVRLVDFAHTEAATTLDDNYLFGLKTVIELLEDILHEGRTTTHVYENQRRRTVLHRYSGDGLMGTDRPEWSDAKGALRIHPHSREGWTIDRHAGTDAEGWEYSLAWGDKFSWEPKSSKKTLVRRRKWVRTNAVEDVATAMTQLSTVAGSSMRTTSKN